MPAKMFLMMALFEPIMQVCICLYTAKQEYFITYSVLKVKLFYQKYKRFVTENCLFSYMLYHFIFYSFFISNFLIKTNMSLT